MGEKSAPTAVGGNRAEGSRVLIGRSSLAVTAAAPRLAECLRGAQLIGRPAPAALGMAAALERALGPALPGEGSEAPLPPLPVLVLGPAGSGRTSLLLRTALAGGADGPRVLFLAPSAIPRLPEGPGGTGTDPRALQVSGAGGTGRGLTGRAGFAEGEAGFAGRGGVC